MKKQNQTTPLTHDTPHADAPSALTVRVGEITFPDGLESIGANSFENGVMTAVTIPGTVKKIDSSAFRGCEALTTITLKDGVEKLGSYALMNCTALTELSIPDSVTEIGADFAKGCTALEKIEIGSGVKSLPYEALHSCTSVKEIVLGKNVASFGANVFRFGDSLKWTWLLR